MIDAVCQIDLFHEQRIFVIHDATFLLGSNAQDLLLTKKLGSLTQELYLLVVTKKSSFNQHTKELDVKKIHKFTLATKRALINNLLKAEGVSFVNSEIQTEFENIINNDPFMIESELNKLMLIAENKVITKTMVDQAISDSTELNIFKLTNHLLCGDKKRLLQLFDKLIMLKYQPIELMQVMASQLFNLKLFKLAMIERYTQSEIEQQLKINKFMQFANRDILKHTSVDKLNQVINELTLLDYNIKHGLINPYLGLKLMLSK